MPKKKYIVAVSPRVKRGNETITIRLACIDAPEMAQTPWGQQSADRLKQLLPAGQAVQVREIERVRARSGQLRNCI